MKHAFRPFNFIVLALLIVSISVSGSGRFSITPVRTLDGHDVLPWERIECLQDKSSNFKVEAFHEKSHLTHKVLLKVFEDETPSSGTFALHFAPGWNNDSGRNPILLVHGAGDNAYRAWVHPCSNELGPEDTIKYPGLMQYLSGEGFQVFAITFAHPHGDNLYQAEVLADAIQRIRKVLNRESDSSFKVDLISHSKGGFPVFCYLSSIGKQCAGYQWLTPFRGDVGRYIALACPFKGTDMMFRYYMYNLSVVETGSAAPLAPKSMVYMMQNLDFRTYNRMFTGQLQVLHNFFNDEDPIPFTPASATTDMNLTMNALYFGGTSAFLSSDGIDKAIIAGGNLVQKLNKTGADPSVKITVLCGTNNLFDPDMEYCSQNMPLGELIPSDGVVYQQSGEYTDGICRRGAPLIMKKVLYLNHLNISFHDTVKGYVKEALSE
ncbi:MAG: hypothetical protein PHW04_04060 [Candidatus Wallbacteria bacterium]|nr:hypothetical protein [Candidatus Wallbacteria bacterium]